MVLHNLPPSISPVWFMSVLEHIRVLDFGRFIAGPFCAALLGDLGAEVIRVEKVDGSEDRTTAPIGKDLPGSGFLHLNRNKKGLTLNPKKPSGAEILKKLVATADVVVVNLPRDTLQDIGMDYESLCRVKPDIILTTTTAYGEIGPYSTRVGFDAVAQAMSGNMHLTGHEDEPMKNYFPYVDFQTASLNALGTVAAIMHRNQTGEGQHVKGSLLGSALTLTNGTMIEQQFLAKNRVATGNRGQTTAPSDAFPTTDGWVMVQIVGNPLYTRWANLMGENYWLEDPKFKTDETRGDNSVEISERMRRWTQKRTTEDVLVQLAKVRIPCGEVLSPQEAMNNEQVAAMQFLKPLSYPGLSQAAMVARMPTDFSTIDNSIRQRAPTLGEHTDEILLSLGYSQNDIFGFRSERAV